MLKYSLFAVSECEAQILSTVSSKVGEEEEKTGVSTALMEKLWRDSGKSAEGRT